jgi:Transposase
MKRSRYTEEQIIGILKEQEAGAAVAELCRRHGMMSDFRKYARSSHRFRAKCLVRTRTQRAFSETDRIASPGRYKTPLVATPRLADYSGSRKPRSVTRISGRAKSKNTRIF